MKINVVDGQSLFDIALIVAGHSEAVYQLAYENGLSITDVLYPGQVLEYSGQIFNRDVIEYYENNKLTPSTGINEDIYIKIFDYFFDQYFE